LPARESFRHSAKANTPIAIKALRATSPGLTVLIDRILD